jgi:hypothetical protein
MRSMTGWPVLRLAAGVAALGFMLTPSVALADCMMPAPVKEAALKADILFVGTVTETTSNDTWASVAVEEVWRGPDLPADVVVKGGPGGNAMTSVDRTFWAGVKYLFFPYADEQGALADNSCTNTMEWSADLAQIRPAEVRQPLGTAEEGDGFDIGGLVAPLGVALLVAGALLVTGLLARGRTS